MKRLLPLILTLTVAAPAASQADDKLLDQVFSSVERRLIREYYGQHQPEQHRKAKKVPPGLAKKGGLPPGIAKKQSLPPGIAMNALPYDLEGRLPPLRAGQRRMVVDNDVLLVDMATNVVIDVLEDVFAR